MTKASLLTVLLVAAALAGCTGGTDDDEGQPPTDLTESATTSGSQGNTTTRGPGGQGPPGNDRHSYEPHLTVSPNNGTAPLNVTIEVDVTWCDEGRHTGQDGNGTTGSSTESATGPAGNGTGNGTGGNGTAGNGTATQGQGQGQAGPCGHPLNPSRDNLTWTLEVRFNATTANATVGGNATGNGTGGTNSTTTTTTTTSSSSTTTGSSNGTGTNTTGNGTGNTTVTAFAHGDLVASFNGTGEDLPSNRSVLLNESGSYDVVFTVTYENGTNDTLQQMVAVGDLPPGSPLGNETSTFEGGFIAAAPEICHSEDFDWVLNSTFAGGPADVSHLNVTLDVSGFDFGPLEIMLFAPNGTEIASGEEINVEGPFGNGTYLLHAESCAGADAEYTITAIAHYTTPGYVAKGTADEEDAP